MSKALDKIKKIAASEESLWSDEARERQQNKTWRKRSFQIAARILIEVRRQKPINGMTQKMLAEKMGVAPQYINKVVKGQENLTLETIAKFEEVLGITLINVIKPELHFEIESLDYNSKEMDSKYHDLYSSSNRYFHKILIHRHDEDYKFPFDNDFNIFSANFNRNKILEKLSSYYKSEIRDNSELKDNTFPTYLYEFARNLLEVKKDKFPSTMPNEPIKIIWYPDKSKVNKWENFSSIKYSEKSKYEHEG